MFEFCHCVDCAKVTGAAAAALLFFKEEVRSFHHRIPAIEFKTDHLQRKLLTMFVSSWRSQQVVCTARPSEIVSTFEDTMTETGNSLIRRFCAKCGSTLFIPNEDTGVLIVPYGGLNDVSKEWKLTSAVWCRNKKDRLQEPVPHQSPGVSCFPGVAMVEVSVNADIHIATRIFFSRKVDSA